jgi:beta-glucanase (GH16 family)
MPHLFLKSCLLVLVLLATCGPGYAQNWVLTWSDEFEGPANSAPDQTKWQFDIGGGGWGNNELEYYTNRRENSFLDGQGNLIIRSLQENYRGEDGVRRDFTSARLNTAGKFRQRFGRFEARIKLPFGQGIWPAFWMLGENIGSVGWPACGEIDMMENIGREPSVTHATLHGPGYSGGNSISSSFTLPAGERLTDQYHVFALDWEPNILRFYIDGNLIASRTPADIPPGTAWVFDHPFFMLLNVAVGGNWPGNPDQTTVFPQTTLIDYVRVYTDQNLADRELLIASAVIDGKNLIVSGERFIKGAMILIDGLPRSTKFVSATGLRGKKLAKQIQKGQTVTIQVQNPGGALSNEVRLSRR